MNIDEVREITNKLRGWLTPAEGELLYNLAKNCTGKGVIVEIGSWVGKSTIHLAAGSQEGSQVPVFAIDPHTGCTVHLVDGEVDGGAIVAQAAVDVCDDDTLETLEARVHDAEHELYPEALRRLMSESWTRIGRRITFAPAGEEAGRA